MDERMSMPKRLGWAYIFWFYGVGNLILSLSGYALLLVVSTVGLVLMGLQYVTFIAYCAAHWMIDTPQVVPEKV